MPEEFSPLHPISEATAVDIPSGSSAVPEGASDGELDLLWHEGRTARQGEAAIAACVAALAAGQVVAVRTGGLHQLVCDATSDAAVQSLREKTACPHRPLSVLVPESGDDGLGEVRRLAHCTPAQQEALASPRRPIVLVARRSDAALSPVIAPGLDEVGVQLPSQLVHRRLLDGFGRPVVATVGRINGEAVLCQRQSARQRRATIANMFRSAPASAPRGHKEPVYRETAGAVRPLRLGSTPGLLEFNLPFRLRQPMLAMGARYRNTVALAWNDRAVVSAHVGDLDSPQGYRRFQDVLAELQDSTGVRAEIVVCDAHPEFANSRSARGSSLDVREVFHHHAHASAVYGEFGIGGDMLCVCWDGAGYGSDGTIWGGETFFGGPGRWKRVASLRPYRLPSTEEPIPDGRRLAQTLCWEAGLEGLAGDSPDVDQSHRSWLRGIDAPWSSSAGRLFDAAAALVGAVAEPTYDAHGPLALEALAHRATRSPEVSLPSVKATGTEALWCLDWTPIVPVLADDRIPAGERARAFHEALADGLAGQLEELAAALGVEDVGLAGGVFQNRVLTRHLVARLERAGLRVRLPLRLPVNDGALAFGQLVEAAVAHPAGQRAN